MPFIQNIALMDVANGFHKPVGANSVLMQIMDTDCDKFPIPKYSFRNVYQFKFLDVEEDTPVIDENMKISDAQAEHIANILKHALIHGDDVIVHCHAGVCRSGAVCEVGVMMGFDDTFKFRAPNLLVKKKILKYASLA